MSNEDCKPTLLTSEAIYDEDSGTSYTPYIDTQLGQVGYRCERDDGSITFIYMNASGGSDDGVATIFVYQDETGDGFVESLHYYSVWVDDDA